jgi:hypothetical protein
MDRHLVAYYIGIAILFAVSLVTLSTNKTILKSSIRFQGLIILVATLLIAYYFTAKEKIIYF